MSTLSTANITSKAANTPPVIKDVNGTECGQFARAWVNINQTGTQAIRDSFNVASITDGSTGRTTVTFTNAMPNANYAIVIGAAGTGSYSDWSAIQFYKQSDVATTSFRVENVDENDNYYDTNGMSVVVFGG